VIGHESTVSGKIFCRHYTDVNQMYVDRGTVKGLKLTGFWSDAGKFETLVKAANFIAKKKSGSNE
jgi:dTDP-glucose pyrophosphorylase